MNKRKILAFIFAPLLPSIFFLFYFDLTDSKFTGLILIFSILFSYIPCFFIDKLLRGLEKRKALSVANVVLGGAFLGMVVFYIFGFVFAIFLDSSKNILPTISEMLSGTLLGISVALPFSIISGFPLFISKKRDNV